MLQICWFCGVHCSFGAGLGSSARASEIETAKAAKRNTSIAGIALIATSIADLPKLSRRLTSLADAPGNTVSIYLPKCYREANAIGQPAYLYYEMSRGVG